MSGPTPAKASASASATSELQSSLSKLSIGEPSPIRDIPRPAVMQEGASKPKSKPKKSVADSWEDELESSEDEEQPPMLKQTPCDSDIESPLTPSISTSAEGPLDPPPTPISPQTSNPWGPGPSVYGSSGTSPSSTPRSPASTPSRRPEKQTAVAGRMIAGALGIRAPKRTPEQRAYDRSVKEQEIRRRNREKEEAAKAKEEEEKAKASVWGD